jgi:hypothetical protein
MDVSRTSAFNDYSLQAKGIEDGDAHKIDPYELFKLKSRLSMIYNVTKPTAPKMPRLKKGTKCIKNLLMQVSKDMYEPHISIFFPIFFPIFGAA